MENQFTRTQLLYGADVMDRFVPSVVGLIIAGEILNDLAGIHE